MADQGGEAQPAAQQQGAGWMSTLLKWGMMYFAVNMFMGKWRDTGNPPPKAQRDNEGNPIPIQISQQPHSPLWKSNVPYNLRVYLSEEPDLFSVIYAPNAIDSLVYTKPNLPFSCDTASFAEKATNFTVPPCLQNNGSYYAHIVMTQSGYPYDEKDADYDHTRVIFRSHPLTTYRKKPTKKNHLLFSSASEAPPNSESQTNASEADTIIAFWKPQLTIRPLCDFTTYNPNAIPPQLRDHYDIEPATNQYLPVLYMDDFWLLSDKLIALNSSVSSVPLLISVSPISQWKFMLQIQMQSQYEQQAKWGMANSEEDNDEVRRLLMESNPILLGITMIVTVFHTVFDFLAFKNDIQFWHKTESVRGLSVRTIFLNCFCQFIIFLYLMDQDTTWMILISSGIGVCIECWKITQAAKVSYGFDGYPWIKVEDKETYSQSETKKYDQQAMRYLSYVFYPALFGYTVYSLMYNEHKGWYSFVVGTLVSFIYMFGFIMMCPQLYLNYKLKSTAFLPWRMMTYKFLNTIIDDLFAFLIKMPTMHRLSCFRDDIVFLIYLYQKWIYRTDYSRVNEYGFKKKDGSNQESAIEASAKAQGEQGRDEIDEINEIDETAKKNN